MKIMSNEISPDSFRGRKGIAPCTPFGLKNTTFLPLLSKKGKSFCILCPVKVDATFNYKKSL